MLMLRYLQGSLTLMIFVSSLFDHGVLGIPANIAFGTLAILASFVPLFLIDGPTLLSELLIVVGRKPFLVVGAIIIAAAQGISLAAAIAGGTKLTHNEPITTLVGVLTLVIAVSYGFSSSAVRQVILQYNS